MFIKSIFVICATSILLTSQARGTEVFLEDSLDAVADPEISESYRQAVFQGRYSSPSSFMTGKCTNTFISNEGHFITALHCIRRCLEHNRGIKGYVAPAYNGRRMIGAFMLVDRKKMMGKTCTIEDTATGEKVEAKYILSGPGIDFIGNGPILSLAAHTLDGKTKTVEKLLKHGLAHNLDFAILKWPSKKTKCVKANTNPMQQPLNSQLASLSYPSKTGWTNDSLSDGKTRLLARGQIYKNHQKSKALVNMADFMGFDKDQDGLKQRKIVFDIRGMLISNLPAYQGSSGATVLDRNGRIVAVTSFIMKDIFDKKSNSPGVTYLVQMNNIVQQTRQILGQNTSAKVFNCQK